MNLLQRVNGESRVSVRMCLSFVFAFDGICHVDTNTSEYICDLFGKEYVPFRRPWGALGHDQLGGGEHNVVLFLCLLSKVCIKQFSRVILCWMCCVSVKNVGEFALCVCLTGGQLPKCCRFGWSCLGPDST